MLGKHRLSYPLFNVARMSTFVLLPGAWLGAWVWQPLAGLLHALGHHTHALTLPADKGAGLETHVRKVLAFLSSADLHDVILVGHSYAGMVAGQVADRASDRVTHTVFLDANLPRDGCCMTDSWSARGQQLAHAIAQEHHGWWPVPELEEFDGHDLAPEQIAWLLHQARPHPAQTIFDPARLSRPLRELSATYVTCLRPDTKPRDDVMALHGEPTWRFTDLDTGHWPMLSRPEALAALLHDLTTDLSPPP